MCMCAEVHTHCEEGLNTKNGKNKRIITGNYSSSNFKLSYVK